MERNVRLEEISDGRLYGINDMVKAGCNDCTGCSICCTGMGKSIVIDPLDIYRITTHFNISFENLLVDRIELNVVDGVILPNIKMTKDRDCCSYLDNNGRCSIHEFRPGICRLFPLGRIYDNHDFKYFLQVNECPKANKTKVKVSKWIDTPELKKNQKYVSDWHYLLKDVQQKLKESNDESYNKEVNMKIISIFFLTPYDSKTDFYEQFQKRVDAFIY